jgi:hypothetical protein
MKQHIITVEQIQAVLNLLNEAQVKGVAQMTIMLTSLPPLTDMKDAKIESVK